MTEQAMAAFLPVLNRALAKALAYAPAARARLSTLPPTCWRIHISDLKLDLDVRAESNVLLIDLPDDRVPDADIRGQSKDFVALLRADDKTAALASLPIRVEGSTSSFMQLQSLVSQLDFDYEACLEDQVGDLAAHQLGIIGRGVWSQVQQTTTSVSAATERYLLREKGWLVTRTEAAEHGRAIHKLRLDIDRLSARLRQRKEQG
ncbi:SCP2 domain-containing protein [Salinispirillum marinum]|uniref:SCP2 domain-containing protein n=2 Tax=Saccharospirillaceae TaxID=255527 RepID=A0ABV8BH08_9GAMM